MASVQQGEKQLFEKFWRGTFKAVATPRPGSAIVASITARKPSCEAPSSFPLPDDKRPLAPLLAEDSSRTNGCVRLKDSREPARYKSHSPTCDEEFTPPPARGKKKKKKSTRKKRRRSPSCSPSPVKKKKKKKNSKKRKRHRLSSKKRRHSSSSPKSKRKEERKHKKHTRVRPRKSQRHHHHHYRSGSESPNSFSESGGSRPRARLQEESHKAKWKRSQHSSKSTRKPSGATEVTDPPLLSHATQNNRFPSATEVISESGSSAVLFKKAEGQLGQLTRQKLNGERYEYDSGNDTSSPPSTQTSSSRSKGSQEASCQVRDGFGQVFSSEKVSSGSSSDSGNSFTSCFSRTKGPTSEDLHPSPHAQTKDQRRKPLQSVKHSEKRKHSPASIPFSSSPLRSPVQNESSTSRSSPESSHSPLLHHKAGPRSSQSRSCSSGTRSYSRSPSYSSKSCKGSSRSRSSRTRRSPSYSRYSPGRYRERDHRYGSSGKESHRHHDRQRRKQSYSPMRKRRRDSPSHLEARRITSARKRPIPYYRPSPSSSSSPSSASSYSSWYSNLSPSPSRSRSVSSNRTGRSRSWSSSSSNGSRSRSHSSGARNSRRSCSRSSKSAGSCDSMRR
ncbi:serine/arginine repetitive matrix protein 4 isoform X1 [Paroedura picta]|uniref:serine/arginine repetitive matrix protein 4 isoform X1 n=1 Tax=Paroedura picta TaxID=143630 RepID=UPI00405612E7